MGVSFGLVTVEVLSLFFVLEFFSLDYFSLLFLGVDEGNAGLLSIFSRALAWLRSGKCIPACRNSSSNVTL
jgi:hypothetical protein